MKQSATPRYGRLPSAPFFILISLVFKLSGGKEQKAQTTPEIAEALII